MKIEWDLYETRPHQTASRVTRPSQEADVEKSRLVAELDRILANAASAHQVKREQAHLRWRRPGSSWSDHR